jgi:hypothetical protein
MVKRLKQNRSNCRAAIERDQKDLANIEGEEARILERYHPLCKKLEAEYEERDRINAQINSIQGTFAEVISIFDFRPYRYPNKGYLCLSSNMFCNEGYRYDEIKGDEKHDGRCRS